MLVEVLKLFVRDFLGISLPEGAAPVDRGPLLRLRLSFGNAGQLDSMVDVVGVALDQLVDTILL